MHILFQKYLLPVKEQGSQSSVALKIVLFEDCSLSNAWKSQQTAHGIKINLAMQILKVKQLLYIIS